MCLASTPTDAGTPDSGSFGTFAAATTADAPAAETADAALKQSFAAAACMCAAACACACSLWVSEGGLEGGRLRCGRGLVLVVLVQQLSVIQFVYTLMNSCVVWECSVCVARQT